MVIFVPDENVYIGVASPVMLSAKYFIDRTHENVTDELIAQRRASAIEKLDRKFAQFQEDNGFRLEYEMRENSERKHMGQGDLPQTLSYFAVDYVIRWKGEADAH